MHSLPHILADDFESIGKLILFGIVILFWLIQKIVKLASGNSSAKPVSKRPAPATRNPRPIPPALPPRPAGAIPLPPLAKKTVRPVRTVKKKTPPPIPAGPVASVVSAIQQPRPRPVAPPMPSVATSQSRIAGWLDARTVREQFIMAEAIKPPLSLR
jgi:hypothetical protein